MSSKHLYPGLSRPPDCVIGLHAIGVRFFKTLSCSKPAGLNPGRLAAAPGALPLQPLTALAIGALLWMAGSIVTRMLRRHGLLPPADQVQSQPKRARLSTLLCCHQIGAADATGGFNLQSRL